MCLCVTWNSHWNSNRKDTLVTEIAIRKIHWLWGQFLSHDSFGGKLNPLEKEGSLAVSKSLASASWVPEKWIKNSITVHEPIFILISSHFSFYQSKIAMQSSSTWKDCPISPLNLLVTVPGFQLVHTASLPTMCSDFFCSNSEYMKPKTGNTLPFGRLSLGNYP